MTDVHGFPPGFFRRSDPSPDTAFYSFERLVTHIDDRAIATVGTLYEHLGVNGRVLDVMSSWISHFRTPPAHLNTDPTLPFGDAQFDAVVCCVSVDYLVQPIEVFQEVRRVLVPGGQFVCTFSNRCFPSKAIAGWLSTDDDGRGTIVAEYFRRSGGWLEPNVALCTPPFGPGDPLYAVWSTSAA